ncbi:MAG TPA: phosphoribosylformylglycinamidine synthase I [Candidatus Krumholzibacteria bacterium]|nr:phosphoribosylformylglycinamidine synthase I [Candidatus Krumholzibacteria bacterium]
MTRVAVVEFPGTNCMHETAAALRAAGAVAEIVRWNAPAAAGAGFAAYVVAGGFAYEDRVRAGVIAAKHEILATIAAAAAAGKPVLGVCNGAQVLVESGLVPALESGRVEVALAPNAVRGWSGYYCGWVHLRPARHRGFLAGLPPETLPLPVGHGEGRFTGKMELFQRLERDGQIPLRYVTAAGGEASDFPLNPNGSLLGAAALSNAAGNVVALMPHPERAAWLYQVPETLPGAWGERRRQASGQELLGPGPGLAVYIQLVRAAAVWSEAS